MNAPAPIWPRVAQLVLMLSSNQPGEVVAAAAAIGRTLEQAGLTWHALADVVRGSATATPDPPTWAQDDDAELLRFLAGVELSEARRKFADSCAAQMRTRPLSDKQRDVLRDMAERAGWRR